MPIYGAVLICFHNFMIKTQKFNLLNNLLRLIKKNNIMVVNVKLF